MCSLGREIVSIYTQPTEVHYVHLEMCYFFTRNKANPLYCGIPIHLKTGAQQKEYK